MQSVLVIEDDHDLRVLLRQALEDEGFEVFSAPHGRGGLEMLRETRPLPSVIVLDLRMPIMDGWQFVERLRSGDEELRGLPVIAVTADAATPPPGVTHTLRKPFKANRLVELLRKFVPAPT
jgi:CheY-like chemotaxis protein